MRTIYIDSEFKCHVTGDSTVRAVETILFDGKCDDYVEGYRLIPAGESWVRSDGEVFTGEMIAPWTDDAPLVQAQICYEREKLEEYEKLINELYQEVL